MEEKKEDWLQRVKKQVDARCQSEDVLSGSISNEVSTSLGIVTKNILAIQGEYKRFATLTKELMEGSQQNHQKRAQLLRTNKFVIDDATLSHASSIISQYKTKCEPLENSIKQRFAALDFASSEDLRDCVKRYRFMHEIQKEIETYSTYAKEVKSEKYQERIKEFQRNMKTRHEALQKSIITLNGQLVAQYTAFGKQIAAFQANAAWCEKSYQDLATLGFQM